MPEPKDSAEAAKRAAALAEFAARKPRRSRKKYSQAFERAAADENMLKFNEMIAHSAKESLIWAQSTKKRRLAVLNRFTQMHAAVATLQHYVGAEFTYQGLFGVFAWHLKSKISNALQIVQCYFSP